MREVKIKSVVPIYGFGAVWLIYCLIFPVYKLWHFIVLVCVSAAVYAVLERIFPTKVEYIKEEKAPEPVSTGNPEIDALLREGERAVNEMKRLQGSIKSEQVREKIGKLITVTDKIFKDVIDDPADFTQIRRFADYFLPTTIKLLNAYDRMADIGADGNNIAGSMTKIEDILDTTLQAYNKQLDALFLNQALDIETDITVLESMLKKEGLSGKDF